MSPELIATLAGMSVAVLIIGMLRSNLPAVAARRRMEGLAEPSTTDSLSSSFAQRAVLPAVDWAVRATTGLLPARIVASVRRRLELAGEPMSAQRFLVVWTSSGVVLPVLIMLALVIANGNVSPGTFTAFLLWMGIGSYIPWLLLRKAAQKRMRAIQKGLPDATDLVITNLEAGLGLQAALLTVSEKLAGPVAEEFGRAVRAINLGRNRTEAFMQMADRSGSSEMRLFARAVAQSEQTGIPIAHVLRNHAKESRERRRQRAREQAAKVPIKITLPTVLFMFPTIFLLILGPVIIYAIDLIGSGGQ
jgi:tight adherence protein C